MNNTQNTQIRWQKLKDIFDEVIELNPTKRAEYLSAFRVNENTLYQELTELIEVEEEARDFLDKPILFDVDDSEKQTRIGETFGQYKIVNEIGYGGMGVVFEALRDDGEFEQKVAIKLTNQSIFSKELESRFRNERQILASLEHPNIVKLFDGGITKDKIPFYVMEYVEGNSLNDYCRENNFNIEQRLELFLQVCEAVAYAHRRLIVHRDIKPDNILVTKKGRIKLLDFGIAKTLDADSKFQTMTQNAPLTPGYSSPEQIRGEIISTSSDIFSLGIILYELLTEKNPTEIFGVEKLNLSKAICETEPQSPSQNVSGKNHLSLLSKQKKTDLDNIILKAMRIEPETRYSSVEQFIDDIKSYLKGLSVKAHPQSFHYNASKFIRRNKLPIAASTIAVLLVLTGLSLAIWQSIVAQKQQQIAEQRFNQVRKIANSLIMEYHDEIAKLDGSTKLREKLVMDSVQYLDEISKEETNNPELLKEVGIAYRKIGNVQGESYTSNLGKFDDATRNYQKSVDLLEKASTLSNADKTINGELIDSYRVLAFLKHRTGDNKVAHILIDKAIKVAKGSVLDKSLTADDMLLILPLELIKADITIDDEKRLELYEIGVKKATESFENKFSDIKALTLLYRFHGRVATNQKWRGNSEAEKGNYTDARKLFEKSLKNTLKENELNKKRQELVGKINKRSIVISNDNLCSVYTKLGKYIEASEHLQIAEKYIKEARKSNPNDQELILDEVVFLMVKEELLTEKGNIQQAIEVSKRGLELAIESYQANTSNIEAISWIGKLSEDLANLLEKQNNNEEAENYRQMYKKYQKLHKEMFGKDWEFRF